MDKIESKIIFLNISRHRKLYFNLSRNIFLNLLFPTYTPHFKRISYFLFFFPFTIIFTFLSFFPLCFPYQISQILRKLFISFILQILIKKLKILYLISNLLFTTQTLIFKISFTFLTSFMTF